MTFLTRAEMAQTMDNSDICVRVVWGRENNVCESTITKEKNLQRRMGLMES